MFVRAEWCTFQKLVGLSILKYKNRLPVRFMTFKTGHGTRQKFQIIFSDGYMLKSIFFFSVMLIRKIGRSILLSYQKEKFQNK
ncbi:MAG: hypothetical protein AAF519_12090, partial [Bacteroidota bacterium]